MNLLIRADASTQIGTGHVMRCLALAQAWQDRGGQAVFAMAEEVPALRSRLETEGFELRRIEAQPGDGRDAAKTVELARRLAASWVAAIETPELIPQVAERFGSQCVVISIEAKRHFTEQTPLGAKRYLREQGFSVRL